MVHTKSRRELDQRLETSSKSAKSAAREPSHNMFSDMYIYIDVCVCVGSCLCEDI